MFELVYVITPSLLLMGATNEKETSPTVFAGTEKLLRTVVIFVTWLVGPTTSYPLLKTWSFIFVQINPSVEVAIMAMPVLL